MIFCNTKEETRQVCTFLAGKGLPAAMLSSDLPAEEAREGDGEASAPARSATW